MKTEWDYTKLASFYDKRADYSDEAIDQLIQTVGIKPGETIADIGAGTGKLTTLLLERGFIVKAVEPNDEMRKYGIENTKGQSVTWSEGTGEATGLPNQVTKLVTFGSSFNVTKRDLALIETKRLLKPKGWFACMWNHRDLNDPTQAKVESIIKSFQPSYDYGTRREDQTATIENSGLFKKVIKIEGPAYHSVSVNDYVDAWRSHATLERQTGNQFPAVIKAIAEALKGKSEINVPFITHIWCAQLKD